MLAGRNDALADLPTLRLSVQVSFLAEATQASPQPANVFPAAALAVSVTVRPAVYFWMQVFVDAVPMHFPAGAETVPLPLTVITSVPAATAVKFALTDFAVFIVTVQVGALPVQAPVQPEKDAPAAGVAVSVTAEFVGRFALHAEAPLPQLIPPPLTVPLPVTTTESSTDVAPAPLPVVNDAVTDLAAAICTVQVGVAPLHAPPQPENVAPAAGVAVSVTVAFTDGVVLQVVAPLPQLIPVPVTVPDPKTETVSRKPAPPTVPPAKVAVTLFDSFIRTVQVVPDPPQAPVQPVNVAPVAGEAISVTVAFRAKFAEQMTPPLPQLIAPAPPLTLPLPSTVTVSFGSGAKVAVTLRATSIVRLHSSDVPEQDVPDHPVNMKPSSGVAFRTTVELVLSCSVQLPGPWHVTPPPSTLPLPVTVTDRSTTSVDSIQLALSVLLALILIVQASSVSSHAPPQPAKIQPGDTD